DQIESTPLALRMLAAADAPTPERRRQLRHIGDTSLYVSGFWSESLEGRVVDVDYYIEMGGSAYGELARGGLRATDPLGDVFGELAVNFVRLVGALALISRRVATPTSDRDILRLYRHWQRTKSANAAARLAALGVVPPTSDGRLQCTAGDSARGRCWHGFSSGWRCSIASKRASPSTPSSSMPS